jgi:hypothetical protein
MSPFHKFNFEKKLQFLKNVTSFRFEKQLIIALKEKGWDGKEEEDTVSSLYKESLNICSPLSLLFFKKSLQGLECQTK